MSGLLTLVFCACFVLYINALVTDTCIKTIAVFGGTGFTGRECVYQALQAGYKVVTLARNPEKLLYPPGSSPEKSKQLMEHPNLKVVTGDVKIQKDVDAVFDDSIDGVIVALGGRIKNVGPTMLTDGTSAIINAMKSKSAAKRIAIITSVGAGESEKKAPWTFRALMYTVMRGMFKDKNNQEQLFLSPQGPGHDLEYTIVRPGGLGNGPPTGVINVNELEGGSIQRADLASFCLRSITEANFPFLRKASCLSSINGIGWQKEPEKGFDAPAEE